MFDFFRDCFAECGYPLESVADLRGPSSKLHRAVVKNQLSKSQRLFSRKEISAIFKSGLQWQNSVLRIKYSPRQLSYSRFAVIVSRKIGNAVIRNKTKRVCREIYRTALGRFILEYDLLMIPLSGKTACFNKIEHAYLDFVAEKRK